MQAKKIVKKTGYILIIFVSLIIIVANVLGPDVLQHFSNQITKNRYTPGLNNPGVNIIQLNAGKEWLDWYESRDQISLNRFNQIINQNIFTIELLNDSVNSTKKILLHFDNNLNKIDDNKTISINLSKIGIRTLRVDSINISEFVNRKQIRSNFNVKNIEIINTALLIDNSALNMDFETALLTDFISEILQIERRDLSRMTIESGLENYIEPKIFTFNISLSKYFNFKMFDVEIEDNVDFHFTVVRRNDVNFNTDDVIDFINQEYKFEPFLISI